MRLCSIASGSSGNCIYIGTDDTHLLVDAGISGKRIEQGLNTLGLTTGEMQGILVTHEHSDHISGLGVVARKYGIPIFATRGTCKAVQTGGNIGKVDFSLFHEIAYDENFEIGDVQIHPFRISHDAAQPSAYVARTKTHAVAVATDMGVYNDYIVENLKGLDALLLEANHDINMLQVGSYPYYLKQRILGERGHLSNVCSGQLLTRILHEGMKTVLLGHLSRENNYAQLAYETVRMEITMGQCPYKGDDFSIQVAKRDEVTEPVNL